MMGAERETERWGTGPEALALAVAVLDRGGLVALPTETVYGLGADARSGAAVARIYEAKGRPSFNPLIAHVATPAQAFAQGRFEAAALRLAEAFWPGPLTLVVRAAPSCSVCELARAGLPTVALRVPSHPVASALLQRFGAPVAAPSANRSGRISPTTADHVAADLTGRVDMILDGGPTHVGLESTIVACVDGQVELLRPGGIPREALGEVLGRPLDPSRRTGAVIAPGLLASHYAPHAAVRLDAASVRPDECVLDFGGRFEGAPCIAHLDLSPERDLREAAANLFGHLHRLDATGVRAIAVAPVPPTGLGEAINDRLRRAAAPRS
jgi:L-threonylcarbamoyladenylate synthase